MFDKLKSLFIEEDENAKKATPKSSSQQSTPQPTPAKAAPKGMVTPREDNYVPPTSGKPNEKFVNILMGALEKNNLQGFDYLEFKQALQNLGSVQMDEATRYKSAMAMAQTMGATPQVLQSSADKYISVLKAEERKFLESFNKQQSARLNAQTSAIQSLEKSISDKTKRIEQLKTEIEAEKKSLESKKQTSNKAAAKVTATKDGFYIAYNIVVNQIKQDLDNIKKYL